MLVSLPNFKSINKKLINLLPAFIQTFPSPIWQIKIDEISGLAAVEVKDPTNLITSYSIISLETGAFLLEGFRAKELWWSGLEFFHDNILYLHGYTGSKTGNHKGIQAYQSTTGELRWQNQEVSFVGFTDAGLWVQPVLSETNEFLNLLHLLTGEILQTGIPFAEAQKYITNFHKNKDNSFYTPNQYPETNPYFKDLSQLIIHKTKDKPVLSIDYCETNRNFVTGYYTNQRDNGNYNYSLIIFDGEGKVLLEDIIETNLTGIGSDNFFIFRETLILIKNRKALHGYPLANN